MCAALDLPDSQFPNVLPYLPKSQPDVMKPEECTVRRVLTRCVSESPVGWQFEHRPAHFVLVFWGRGDGGDGRCVSAPVGVVVTV